MESAAYPDFPGRKLLTFVSVLTILAYIYKLIRRFLGIKLL